MVTAVVLTWVVLALGAALLIGRSIRSADTTESFPARPDVLSDDLRADEVWTAEVGAAQVEADQVPGARTPLPSS
jgi:hypothetical protein